MRMIQYELTLREWGYVVASGDMRGDDHVDGPDCLPMRVELMKGTFEELLETIDIDSCSSEEFVRETFRSHYRDILQGTHPDYYLYTFCVNADCVVLWFYDKVNGTTELVVLSAPKNRLQLKFAVPHHSNGSYASYLVTLSTDYGLPPEHTRATHIQVTEYVGSVRRDLDFFSRETNKPAPEYYVVINEYVE